MNEWGELALRGRPARFGVGITTPVDVLSYRALWNAYVLQTACALYAQAWVFTQMAASSSSAVPTTIDTSSSGIPCAAPWAANVQGPLVDASTIPLSKTSNPSSLLQSYAGATRSSADLLMADWNQFQNLSDAQIVLQGASILTTYQKIVIMCGQVLRPTIVINSPGIAAALSQGPDESAQAQLVAGIQGAGILADGVLQIIGTGAAGVIQTYETLGDYAKRVANAITSPAFITTITVVAILVAGVLVYLELPHWRSSKKAPEA
jgi:hypothetical protein